MEQASPALSGTTGPTTDERADTMRNWGMLLLLLALSLLFYWRAIDNSFWHAEDFLLLDTAQRFSESPSELLGLNVVERHHPVPLALFLMEYSVFGLQPQGYYLVNLVLHGINAFLVYWMVALLLPDRRIAVLSGILFVFGVGSYGKAVMFVAGAENLLITLLSLLIINLYIRNDLWQHGRILTWRYAAVLFLFLFVSFAKPTAFSLIGCLLAYKIFFRGERGSGRRLLEPNIVILVVGAVVFWFLREITGVVDFGLVMAGRTPVSFVGGFIKNMIMYLVHMFFPIHVSRLVETSNPVVRAVYAMAPVIRFAIGLSLISYGLFGFVFGNRTIRFFLTWTVISVLPYCAIWTPHDWMNIRYLYQVSIGFTVLMASGTVLSMDLLHRRRFRRFVPLVVPALFVILSAYITAELDVKYEAESISATNQQILEDLRARQG